MNWRRSVCPWGCNPLRFPQEVVCKAAPVHQSWSIQFNHDNNKKNAERSLHFPLASHPQRVLQQSSVRERRGSTFRTNPRSWSFCWSPHTAHVLWDHVAALGALERLRKFWEILEGAEDPVTQRRRTSTAQQGTKHGATAAGFKNNRYEFIPIVFKSQSHCKEAHLNFPGLCTFTLIELTACSGRTFPHHIWNDTPVRHTVGDRNSSIQPLARYLSKV